VLLRPASGAWAGGSPFATQPILALADSGGNLIKSLFFTAQGSAPNVTVELRLPSAAAAAAVAAGQPLERGALLGTTTIPLTSYKARFFDLGISQPTQPFTPLPSTPATATLYAHLPPSYTLVYGVHVPGYGYFSAQQEGFFVALSGEAALRFDGSGGLEGPVHGAALGFSVGVGESVGRGGEGVGEALRLPLVLGQAEVLALAR
jgi:hypothetical protein